ncbi:MAG: tetratricopeptide repeat protein [Pseudoalteromonas sp.]|uniref:tetratricopeptide repeat protein n=2 Tax=Pseudoalteromonas TaxID=53246 RepID=UPI001F2C2B9D|nr:MULTISPECIES: tetratricopeptide repeat protein [unclassified Pseudoalteromonas]MDP2636019.1 tetratricopeptide repeat protein [Pseudoalteromonas sp. 1_MG-2023]
MKLFMRTPLLTGLLLSTFLASFITSAGVDSPPKNQDKLGACSSEHCKQEFKKLKQYSRQQIPIAQEMMGSFYYNGYGVEKDLKKARRYFYEAARWDLPNSQFKLGIMMLEGEGGEVNVSLGLTNLRKAAKKLKKAHYFTAVYLLLNNPSQEDVFEAKEKLELAANKGHVRAHYLLAKLHESTMLGKADKEKSLALYKKIANRDPRAKQKLVDLGVALPREPKNKDIERIEVVREKQTMDMFISGLKNLPSMRASTSSRIRGSRCNDTIPCSSISGDEDLRRFKQGATQAFLSGQAARLRGGN